MLTTGGMPDITMTRVARRMRGQVLGNISHEQWRRLIREVQPVRRVDRGRLCYCGGAGSEGHVHV